MGKKKDRQRKIILGIVVLIIFTYFIVSGIKIIKLQSEQEQAQAENQQLLEKKENLKAELDIINSKEYIEGLARRDLKLVKSNELLFILPEFKSVKGQKEKAEKETLASKETKEKEVEKKDGQDKD